MLTLFTLCDFETYTYRVPAFAIAPLRYTDYRGVQDDEEAFVDNLKEWLNETHGEGTAWHIGHISEPYHGRSDFEGIVGQICNVDIEVII